MDPETCHLITHYVGCFCESNCSAFILCKIKYVFFSVLGFRDRDRYDSDRYRDGPRRDTDRYGGRDRYDDRREYDRGGNVAV